MADVVYAACNTHADVLEKECRLAEQLVYKNFNQHRRTRYFMAFRALHTQVIRAIALLRRLKNGHFVGFRNAKGASTPAAADKVAMERMKLLESALSDVVVRVVMHSRSITSTQRGMGFASLLTVMTAIAANCVFILMQARDAIRDLMS